MNKKKKGSILLEGVAAIAIVFIIIALSYRIFFMINRSIENDRLLEKNKESLNAVCNEIKYNISFDELKDILSEENISFEYDENFLGKLMNQKLIDLRGRSDSSNRILIKLLKVEEESLFIYVELKYGKSILEYEIEKGRWMDYV